MSLVVASHLIKMGVEGRGNNPLPHSSVNYYMMLVEENSLTYYEMKNDRTAPGAKVYQMTSWIIESGRQVSDYENFLQWWIGKFHLCDLASGLAATWRFMTQA
jgi:hypothetical protein